MNIRYSPARSLVLAPIVVALALAGCADMNLSQTQKGTAVGAGVGAVAGAAIGRDARAPPSGPAWVHWAATSGPSAWRTRRPPWNALPPAPVWR
jgi:hypothetical protein